MEVREVRGQQHFLLEYVGFLRGVVRRGRRTSYISLAVELFTLPAYALFFTFLLFYLFTFIRPFYFYTFIFANTSNVSWRYMVKVPFSSVAKVGGLPPLGKVMLPVLTMALPLSSCDSSQRWECP